MEDRFVITIARGYGSGGKTLAGMLAKELGIPCYDREILRMASDDSGISEDLFGQADERVRKIFTTSRAHYTGKPLGPEDSGFVSNDNLFELQAKVIREIAETESCIIVGRCADHILKDMPHVLRVYLYASPEDCLIRLRKQVSGTDAELNKRRESIDKYRADYYKYYTGHEWNDARNYDLCLNTGSLPYEKLVEAVKSHLKLSMEAKIG